MRAVLLAPVFLACFVASAWAHGDAAWIMENPQTLHCCGPHDCEALPDGAVKEVKDGFQIVATGEVIHWAEGRLYTSVDEQYWWCHYPSEGELRTRCLFVPGNT